MTLHLKREVFPYPETWYTATVSYGEVDRMGYAYYGHYPHWFERSRGQFIRERGMSYDEVERRGVLLPVRDLVVRYMKPAHYDEAIRVRAGVSDWGRASLTFAYQVYGPPDGSVMLAAGTTHHACVTREGRPMAVPGWLRDLFLSA